MDESAIQQDDTALPTSETEVPASAADVPSEEIDTLYRSPMSGLMAARREVVSTPEAWTAAWAEVTANSVPAIPPPPLDVSVSRALVLGMGSRPSGGYAIDVGSLRDAADTLYVVVRETSPGTACGVTMALTQPTLVLRIPIVAEHVAFIEETVIIDCS